MRSIRYVVGFTFALSLFGHAAAAENPKYWKYLDQAQKSCFKYIDRKVDVLDDLVSFGMQKTRINKKKTRYRYPHTAGPLNTGMTIVTSQRKKNLFRSCDTMTVASYDSGVVMWNKMIKSLASQGYQVAPYKRDLYRAQGKSKAYYFKVFYSSGHLFLDMWPASD